MKAVQFAEYGGPDVLELTDVEPPHAGPGEVRIAVQAAGVNPLDWKIRQGQMREMMPRDLPSGTGMDAAGIVDEVGDGVTGKLRMQVARTFTLDQAIEAHRASEAGHVAGRFVVTV